MLGDYWTVDTFNDQKQIWLKMQPLDVALFEKWFSKAKKNSNFDFLQSKVQEKGRIMNSGYSELLQFGMKSRGNKHQPIISRIIDFHGFIHEFSAVGDKQVGLKRMIYDNDVFIEFYDSGGKC